VKPEETSKLLNAYVDRELDPGATLGLEAELGRDPVLKRACRDLELLGAAVRADAAYHEAPQSLRARLTTNAADVPGRWRPRLLRWLPAAAFAAGVLMTWAVGWLQPMVGEEARLGDEAVSSHVRNILAHRAMDVASSDEHAVKPWLSARLDYSPPVRDFAADGFELSGGRLDYLNGRLVADLVYRHRQHIVDVFVWPASPDRPLSSASRKGFNVVHFTRGGMTYWLVSDVALPDLERFAQALPRSSSSP